MSKRIDRAVSWTVVGRNGVTARRTIDELLPIVPEERFDYILLGIGGNDVMKLSSPKKWRRDMLELLGGLAVPARVVGQHREAPREPPHLLVPHLQAAGERVGQRDPRALAGDGVADVGAVDARAGHMMELSVRRGHSA